MGVVIRLADSRHKCARHRIGHCIHDLDTLFHYAGRRLLRSRAKAHPEPRTEPILRIMLMPSIRGVIKRRLLVNFRVDPEVVQRILPEGLTSKLQGDHAIAGICLIRLEQIRPSLIPWPVGLSGENAAHRVAVTWRDADGAAREGVYIPMRHTNSSVILMVRGRPFPAAPKRPTLHPAAPGIA